MAEAVEASEQASQKPVLTAIDLKKRFGRLAAVDGVSLDLKRGEILCVVGPNGAGKTTFLLLLGGVLLPFSGHVTVFGLDRWRDSFRIRQRSTFLTADPIFGAAETPYEFLRFYAQIYGMSKKDFLPRLHELAQGLEMLPNLAKPWDFLSTGMVKKVGLIGALLPDASLRILDEPFAGGVDPYAMDYLFTRLRQYASCGETLIFSTQVLEQAETAADKILLLDKGQVVALGTAPELFAQAGVDSKAPRALYKAFMALTRRSSHE